MNQESSKILNLMSEVRGFFEQIAILLKTYDQIVDESGWSANDSTVTGGNSASINNPKSWAPEFLCRFYLNNKYSHILLYTCVIIDNRDNNESYPADNKKDFEPIITSGYYDYGKKNTAKDWNVWRSRWHIYSEDPNYDGTIYTFDPNTNYDFTEKESNFKKLRSLALPLVDIQNSNDLKIKVINPLLSDLAKQTDKV